jgi:hypothetical protein
MKNTWEKLSPGLTRSCMDCSNKQKSKKPLFEGAFYSKQR